MKIKASKTELKEMEGISKDFGNYANITNILLYFYTNFLSKSMPDLSYSIETENRLLIIEEDWAYGL